MQPNAAATADTPRPLLLTVEQFSQRNPAFTPAAIRNLIFRAEPRQSSIGTVPGNGLLEARAVLRLGRRVLLDEARFFQWLEDKATSPQASK